MDQIGFSRRVFVLLAGIAAVQSLANAQQANGVRGGGMTEQQKMLIPSLPVFPWLSIAETKKTQVRSHIQSLISSHQGYVMVTDGQSVETGGAFINLATSSKQGLLGIDGCSMINLDFGPDEKAQLVSLSIDRGWRNKNVQPLISSLTGRYAAITPPIFIRDGEAKHFVIDLFKNHLNGNAALSRLLFEQVVEQVVVVAEYGSACVETVHIEWVDVTIFTFVDFQPFQLVFPVEITESVAIHNIVMAIQLETVFFQDHHFAHLFTGCLWCVHRPNLFLSTIDEIGGEIAVKTFLWVGLEVDGAFSRGEPR